MKPYCAVNANTGKAHLVVGHHDHLAETHCGILPAIADMTPFDPLQGGPALPWCGVCLLAVLQEHCAERPT